MRIWDLPPSLLCREHLLGEHRELHAMWSVIINNKKGYSKHPETLRWVGKLKALYLKHEEIVIEMTKRGYKHRSDLNLSFAKGKAKQSVFINTILEQKNILRSKKCLCKT